MRASGRPARTSQALPLLVLFSVVHAHARNFGQPAVRIVTGQSQAASRRRTSTWASTARRPLCMMPSRSSESTASAPLLPPLRTCGRSGRVWFWGFLRLPSRAHGRPDPREARKMQTPHAFASKTSSKTSSRGVAACIVGDCRLRPPGAVVSLPTRSRCIVVRS